MRVIPGLMVLLVEFCGWLFLGFLCMIRLVDEPFRGHDFTPEAWATADIPGRTTMTRDAIRHMPSRASEDEVERLLGKPYAIMPSHSFTKWVPNTAVRVWTYTQPRIRQPRIAEVQRAELLEILEFLQPRIRQLRIA
jgi:hypothetical protein